MKIYLHTMIMILFLCIACKMFCMEQSKQGLIHELDQLTKKLTVLHDNLQKPAPQETYTLPTEIVLTIIKNMFNSPFSDYKHLVKTILQALSYARQSDQFEALKVNIARFVRETKTKNTILNEALGEAIRRQAKNVVLILILSGAVLQDKGQHAHISSGYSVLLDDVISKKNVIVRFLLDVLDTVHTIDPAFNINSVINAHTPDNLIGYKGLRPFAGVTPLMAAIKANNYEAVQNILGKSYKWSILGDILEATDAEGKTAFSYAQESPNPWFAPLIEEYKAKIGYYY